MSSNGASGDLILEDINTGEKFNLPQNEPMFTCGRKKTNRIITKSILASRDHCIFLRVNSQLHVIDSKSANGIYINGAIQEPKTMVALKVNDIIGIGCSNVVPISRSGSVNHTVYVLKVFEQPPVITEAENSNTDLTQQLVDETVKTVAENKRRLSADSLDGQVPFKIPKIEERPSILVTQNKNSFRGTSNSGVSSKIVQESPLPVIIDITDDNSSDEDPPKNVQKQQDISLNVKNLENEVTSTSSCISCSLLMDDDEMDVGPDTSTNLPISESSKVSKQEKNQYRPSVISIATIPTLKKKDDDVQSTTRIEETTLNNNGESKRDSNCEERTKREKVPPVLQNLSKFPKKDTIRVEVNHKERIVSMRGHSEDSPLAEVEENPPRMLLDLQDEKSNEEENENFLVDPLDLEELNLHDQMLSDNDEMDVVANKQTLTRVNGDGFDHWIKYEPELDIMDDDESVYKDIIDHSDAPAPTPLKIKRVKEEQKMRFSEINGVTLSDDEEDLVFPASQLFGDEPENEGAARNIKPENDDSEEHEIGPVNDERPDIIVLSDSEDEPDPWYDRLMRSQLNEDREFYINNVAIKGEPEETNFVEDEQDFQMRDIAKDVSRESYDLYLGEDDEKTEETIRDKSKRKNMKKGSKSGKKRDKEVEKSECRDGVPEMRVEEPEKRLEEPEKPPDEPEKDRKKLEKRIKEMEKHHKGPEKQAKEREKHVEESECRGGVPEIRVKEPEKRLEEPEKHRKKPEKRIREMEKHHKGPEKHAKEREKHVEESEFRSGVPEMRVEEPEKRLEEPEKRHEESEKPLDEPEKHRKKPEKHSKEREKHVEESKKHVEVREKQIEELAARKTTHEDRKMEKNREEKPRKSDHKSEPTKKNCYESKRSHHRANEKSTNKLCETEDVRLKESGHKIKSTKYEKRRTSDEAKIAKITDDSNRKRDSSDGKSNGEKNLDKIPVGRARSSVKENIGTIQKENTPMIETKNCSPVEREKSRSIDEEKSRSIDKENSRPIEKANPVVILTKLDHMRKSLQLVEAPFLANGKDRGVSCSVKRIVRSMDKDEEASTTCVQQLPTKEQSEPKITTKQKKESALKAKQKELLRMKEQKLRRMKNKWADCLPPRKKQAGTSLTREEIEEIKNDRKEKLKKIADEKKKAAESNDVAHVKRPMTKAKAKITVKSRNDFLVNEMQDCDAKQFVNSERSLLPNDVKSSEEEEAKAKYSEVIKESLANLGEQPSKSCDKSLNETKKKDEPLNVDKIPRLANEETRVDNSSMMKQVAQQLKSSMVIEPKIDESVRRKICEKSTNATVKLAEVQKSSAIILCEPQPVAQISFMNDNLTIESSSVERNPRTTVGHTLKSLLKQKSSKVTSETRQMEICKKVSFNDLMTKVQFYEIDSANTMNKCPTKDAPVQVKKRAIPGKLDRTVCPKLEQFLLHLFRWNPTWLQEQKKYGTMPPIVDDKKLVPMLSKYRNYEDYYNVMEPLLLLEIWYGITKDFDASEKYFKPPVMCSIVHNSMCLDTAISVNREIRVTTLLLEIVVSKRDADLNAHPVFGDLIFFEYFSNGKGKQTICTIFAYVTNLRQTIIKPFTHFNRDLLKFVKQPYAVLTYTVMTKPLDPINIQTNRVNRLRNVSYLRSNMRMIQALQYLPISPLLNQILTPKIEDYQLPAMNTADHYPLVTKDKLNAKQLEAVVRVTDAVVQKLPKICLIQGPPGTGKTKVIVNLVTEILYGGGRYKNKKMRILVCAPSNAAIDEIVLRLLEVRRTSKETRFKMVRIGRSETMHPTAKDVSLQELARREVKRTTGNYLSPTLSSDSIMEAKNVLEAQINSLQLELTSAQRTGAMHTTYIMRKLSDITTKYKLLMNHQTIETMEPKELSKLQRQAENTLLAGADVIACTLTSCYTNLMETTFAETGETISVCIVDEATQCAEAETLIPLMLGARTLVLVGDTNQLPATIISQKAKQYGLDQSLFARIQNSFIGQENNPIILLDTQYRMSYPVAFWPNKFFYAGALKNAANLQNLPFHFYKVINLDSIQDNDKFSNTDEATFVANLYYTIIARSNPSTANLPVKVGIITPYNNQKTLITKKIKDRIAQLPDKTKKRFIHEVNTVDGFQGQERDVIIMSCVRSNGIGFLSDQQRLCVALTRAKHSLILCGNFKTFERDPMWHALLSDASSRGVHVNIKATASPEEIRPLVIR